MCPHCGEYFTRSPKARKPVEEVDSQLPNEEKGLSAQSRPSPGFEVANPREELMVDQSLPIGRKRKKNPLWEERKESFHEWPRHSRPKKRWNTVLLVMLVLLLLIAGWALWDLRDISGLEALVYWNR
jgi:hypothetical protein